MMNAIRSLLAGLVICAVTFSAAPGLAKEDAKHPETAETEKGGGGGHGGANTNPLSIDPDLAICTAIVFLALLAILAKFAWGPIVTGLDNREQSIADQIEEAKRSAEKANALLQQYDAKLAAAADEVRALMAEARKDADAAKDRIVAAAKEAAQKERERAVEDIRLATDQALEVLAEKVVNISVSLAGRMLRREVDSKAHADLIKESLDQFPSQN